MSSGGKAAKIAISLDERLLTRVERSRRKTGESRSAYVSRALLKLFRDEAREQRVSRYREAYREHPETAADVESARRLARRALSSLEWI